MIINKVDWVTNDPRVAKQLKAIDRAYERKLKEVANWRLAEKAPAIKRAKEQRQLAIDRVAAQLRAEP